MMRPWLVAALLTLPVCAGVPAPHASRWAKYRPPADGTFVRRLVAPLPPIPDSAPTAFGMIPVRRVANLQCSGKPAYGCFYRTTWVIELKDSMPLPLAWASLSHELFHADMQVAGIEFDNQRDEDQIADAAAAGIVLRMRAGWPR